MPVQLLVQQPQTGLADHAVTLFISINKDRTRGNCLRDQEFQIILVWETVSMRFQKRALQAAGRIKSDTCQQMYRKSESAAGVILFL